MSTTAPASAPGPVSAPTDYNRLAEDLFDELFDTRALCPLCFARKRTFYPEYDEALANRLYRGAADGSTGANKVAFEALGHSRNRDGSLQVNSATSDADPATYQDIVPETWIDGEFRPARSQTVCECGVVDYDFDNPRSTRQLYDAIENIAAHLADPDRDRTYDVDCEAAREVIRQATSSDALAGRDRDVLTAALRLGLRHGSSE